MRPISSAAKKAPFRQEEGANLASAASAPPINKQHKETRRLHSRIQTEIAAVLLFGKPGLDGATEIAATIIDVSADSLTIRVQDLPDIRVGSNVTINLLVKQKTISLNGQFVRSAPSSTGYLRAAITLVPGSEVNLEDLISNQSPVDRRKSDRRLTKSWSDEKRQYDRRGFWKGLESKRFFSHHAWELKKNDVYFFRKPLESAVGNHVVYDGRDMIMMASNNYLGLNTHPKVTEAAIEAIKRYGTGSSGSNLVGGTYDIHLELEDALAKFIKVEAVCICISGYVANTTTLTTILNKEDAVFHDGLNHASLIDGSIRTGAYLRMYRHNDMEDLEKKLARCQRSNKLVVADGVFSMDGDIVPLPKLFRLCRKYNANLMLDQAHATGVFGENGGGLTEHFNMDGKVDIIVGTMSKSLAAIGGFIGGSKELIAILQHSARQIFFSTNVPPSACASILAALKVMKEEPERRLTLWRNAEQLRSGLQAMGFNTGLSQSPIIPVIFPTERETNLMAKGLLAQDIYVTPIIYPAVKKNQTRIRLSVIATHTPEDVERTLGAFKIAKANL